MQTRIGKYLLKKKLGAGASGSDYLALDEFSEREVARNFYEAGKSADTSSFARSQFLTEAALAGRLWHPHIALIMDACADDTMSYVVTEFVAGGSLAQFTSPRGLLAVSEVVEIGFKCSGALDYAFRNDVIHRDIKPANILRTATMQVKIADFGVAFIRNAAHTKIMGSANSRSFTAIPYRARRRWRPRSIPCWWIFRGRSSTRSASVASGASSRRSCERSQIALHCRMYAFRA